MVSIYHLGKYGKITYKKMKKLSYYHHVYKKYRADHIKHAGEKFAFYNFWEMHATNNWFVEFFNHHNIAPKKVLNLISVMGPKEVIHLIPRPRLFFTGENVESESISSNYLKYKDHYGKKVDLAVGFKYSDDANYLRFPLWILSIFPPDSSYDTIKNIVNTYNKPEHRLNLDRQRFACNISRHDKTGLRAKIIDMANEISKVDNAGSFLNNTSELKEKYQDNKELFLRNYKINICPENTNAEGYVTEKLFESIRSGCIPLYWGSNNNPEPEILNQNAILFFDPDGNNFATRDQLSKIAQGGKDYQDFAHQKPFQHDAAERIWENITRFQQAIKKIL